MQSFSKTFLSPKRVSRNIKKKKHKAKTKIKFDFEIIVKLTPFAMLV